MPELPEVETVRRGLLSAIQGAEIQAVELRRETLRFPIPPALETSMTGAKIVDITRRSKYLLWQLDNDLVMLSHLGMSGRYHLYQETPDAYKKHEHVVWHLSDGRALVYEDSRRFGIIDLVLASDISSHPLLAGLGPEPLGSGFHARYLTAALARRKGPIKPALMDAKLVVGVGNIYANEACFRARIHPHAPAGKVAGSDESMKLLCKSIKQVLREAIDSGGSSIRDFWNVDGGGGYFQHRFDVYGRAGKPCHHCSTPIQQSRQSGRASFFCDSCQKMPV